MEALDQLKRLARAQCSVAEILQSLGTTKPELDLICRNTFKQSFDEIYDAAKGEGKTLIKLAQYEEAINHGNTEMLKLLGKEVLGQGVKEYGDGEIQHVILLPPFKAVGEKPDQIEGTKV